MIRAAAPSRAAGLRPAAVVFVLLLLACSAAPPAAAQWLEGRVVRAGEGVAGAPVILHRVARDTAGEVASTVTGAEGRFSFAEPPPVDTAGGGFTVFFATADVDGVRYFGPVIHAGDPAADYRVEAFDTTSSPAAADSVRVVRRDVALIPEAQGGWEVGEVLRVLNPAGRTIVPAAGGARPLVGFPLPEGAESFEVGEGSIGADEVLRGGEGGGTVYLRTPLPPGGRDLFVRYVIPAGRDALTLPAGPATDTLNVFVRQPAPEVRVSGAGEPETVSIQGETYLRWSLAGAAASAPVTVEWDAPAPPPVDPRLAAAAVAALVLLAALALALRRRPAAPLPAAPPSAATDAARRAGGPAPTAGAGTREG